MRWSRKIWFPFLGSTPHIPWRFVGVFGRPSRTQSDALSPSLARVPCFRSGLASRVRGVLLHDQALHWRLFLPRVARHCWRYAVLTQLLSCGSNTMQLRAWPSAESCRSSCSVRSPRVAAPCSVRGVTQCRVVCCSCAPLIGTCKVPTKITHWSSSITPTMSTRTPTRSSTWDLSAGSAPFLVRILQCFANSFDQHWRGCDRHVLEPNCHFRDWCQLPRRDFWRWRSVRHSIRRKYSAAVWHLDTSWLRL